MWKSERSQIVQPSYCHLQAYHRKQMALDLIDVDVDVVTSARGTNIGMEWLLVVRVLLWCQCIRPWQSHPRARRLTVLLCANCQPTLSKTEMNLPRGPTSPLLATAACRSPPSDIAPDRRRNQRPRPHHCSRIQSLSQWIHGEGVKRHPCNGSSPLLVITTPHHPRPYRPPHRHKQTTP